MKKSQKKSKKNNHDPPEMVSFKHFFDQVVYKQLFRQEEKRALELYFTSCGLGAKEEYSVFLKASESY